MCFIARSWSVRPKHVAFTDEFVVFEGNTHININFTTFIKHCIEILLYQNSGCLNESVAHIIPKYIFNKTLK
jgi:hypothetical protein